MGGFFSVPHNWAALAFLLFIVLVGRSGYKFITGWLDNRSAEIKAKLDEAARLRAEAEHLLVSYQKKLRDAEREAQEIVAQARADATRLAEDSARALEATVARRTEQAIDRIGRAEQKAVKDVRDLAIDIAIRSSERIIAGALDPAKASQMVDDSIKELDRKLH